VRPNSRRTGDGVRIYAHGATESVGVIAGRLSFSRGVFESRSSGAIRSEGAAAGLYVRANRRGAGQCVDVWQRQVRFSGDPWYRGPRCFMRNSACALRL